MLKFRSAVMGAIAVLAPTFAQAACFTMVDARNRVVYQSTTTPVNITGSISAAMARAYPGRSLIISANYGCAEIDEVTMQRTASASRVLDARRSSNVDYAGTSPAPVPSSTPSSGLPDGTIDDGLPLGRSRAYPGSTSINPAPTGPAPVQSSPARSAPR